MKSKQSAQHRAAFAKGGNDRMFKEQSASPAKPGITGKQQKAAPGPQAATGGPKTSRAASLAAPAAPGKTSPVRKGR